MAEFVWYLIALTSLALMITSEAGLRPTKGWDEKLTRLTSDKVKFFTWGQFINTCFWLYFLKARLFWNKQIQVAKNSQAFWNINHSKKGCCSNLRSKNSIRQFKLTRDFLNCHIYPWRTCGKVLKHLCYTELFYFGMLIRGFKNKNVKRFGINRSV